jgi:hypothetical protein
MAESIVVISGTALYTMNSPAAMRGRRNPAPIAADTGERWSLSSLVGQFMIQ